MLAAARLLLDEGGLDGLTMRALAGRMGVSPNALYSHVESKTALVDGVLDAVLAEVVAPDATGDPAAGLHAVMASTYEVLLAHPGLVPVYVARQGARGPNAQRLGDVMLGLLERAGLDADDAREGLRVLVVFTIGFAAFATGSPLEERAGRSPRADELRRSFDRALRWLLDGIVGARRSP